jgi:xylose isomerase
MNRIGAGVWIYGSCSDRYVGKGYRVQMTLSERLNLLSELDGIEGVEITYPSDFNEGSLELFKMLLEKCHLSVAAVNVELVCSSKWQTGSFTSPDPARREKTLALTRGGMDFAAKVGAKVVNLWLGQDGHDYYMQVDYAKQWQWLIDGLRVCADHRPDVRLGLEYKLSEPRLNCLARSGGIALAVAQSVGRDNVGVTLDVGHALNAGENLAEIATILMSQNRLFHVHLNDNYRIADDDMPIGSVHFMPFVELFFWLRRMGYNGWYSLDMYPYRDDPSEAIRASVAFLRYADQLVTEKLANHAFTGQAYAGDPAKAPSRFFTAWYQGGGIGLSPAAGPSRVEGES